jgi:hypothetical protein
VTSVKRGAEGPGLPSVEHKKGLMDRGRPPGPRDDFGSFELHRDSDVFGAHSEVRLVGGFDDSAYGRVPRAGRCGVFEIGRAFGGSFGANLFWSKKDRALSLFVYF